MPIEESNKNNIAVILLAAGESTRLGHPKQMLLYADQTLLEHTLQQARASSARPIIVVLGAHAGIIKKGFNDDPGTHVILNDNWQEGMASSIRYGVETLLKISPAADGVILLVCDQPYVTTTLLNNLMIAHRETGKPIVASSYENTFGPPVFFHKTLFSELLQLKGDVGAKGVIREHSNEVEAISFPEGNIDIDTEADYLKLSKGTLGNDKRIA